MPRMHTDAHGCTLIDAPVFIRVHPWPNSPADRIILTQDHSSRGEIVRMRRANLWLLLFSGPASLVAADKPVSFTQDIRPIFESSCWKCHGSAVQLSRLDLRSRESALKGGQKGAAIVPGKAAESRLYRVVAALEKPAMPLDGKLTPIQIDLIKDWIDQGAVWEGSAPNTATAAAPEDMPLPPGARDAWAFRKPVRAPLPAISGFSNPIDLFLAKT